jgi:hypothetical protein
MQREKTHLFFTTALYYCSLLLLFTTDMAAHLQEAQREKTQLSFTTALYDCSLRLLFTTDMPNLQEAQREKTQLSDKLSDVLALLQEKESELAGRIEELQVLDLLALLVHALLVPKVQIPTICSLCCRRRKASSQKWRGSWRTGMRP